MKAPAGRLQVDVIVLLIERSSAKRPKPSPVAVATSFGTRWAWPKILPPWSSICLSETMLKFTWIFMSALRAFESCGHLHASVSRSTGNTRVI